MKFSHFLLLLFSVQVLTGQHLASQIKERAWGVGVELSGGYADIAGDGFKDPNPAPNRRIAHGFLDQVHQGVLWSGKILFYLPYGFKIYSDYEIGSFKEKNVTPLLWQRIYGQDFENNFDQRDYSILNQTRGLVFGVSFTPVKLKKRFQPFGVMEIRKHWLRSTTTLEGEAFNFWSIFGPETGRFSGSSLMYTDKPFALAFGVGLEILLPWRFSLTPAWKMISTETKIIKRTIEYTITPREGNVEWSRTSGDLDILDGQGVKLKYREFRLGIRYRIF